MSVLLIGPKATSALPELRSTARSHAADTRLFQPFVGANFYATCHASAIFLKLASILFSFIRTADGI